MKHYHLTIAGIRICLRTPHEISISESLRPFLRNGHEQTDCTISLCSCDALPAFSENGQWHALEYYDCHAGCMRIFHCNALGADPFAVTRLLEDGDIEILVLPAYLSYFTGTEGIFNRIGMETLLLQHNGLLLHASLIKYNGTTVAFTGASGVGKSTQAEIWRKCLGAQILNGDRAALRKEQNLWWGYGSPYAGTSGIYKNDGAPLSAIVFLEQAQENSFQPLTQTQALRLLYPELSVHHWDSQFVARATDLSLQLLAQVPVYLLACRPEESAALLVKKGLGL